MIQHSLVPFVVASAFTASVAAGSCADMPAGCGPADTIVAGKLRSLLRLADPHSQVLAGECLQSLERARALCAGASTDRALKLYGDLLLYMEIQLAAAPELPAMPAEMGPLPEAADRW